MYWCAGEMGRARELLEAALGSGNPQIVPQAQADLGMLLGHRPGRSSRRRELLEAAMGSGNPQIVPQRRAPAPGDLLAEQEDWEGAEGARTQAVVDTARSVLRRRWPRLTLGCLWAAARRCPAVTRELAGGSDRVGQPADRAAGAETCLGTCWRRSRRTGRAAKSKVCPGGGRHRRSVLGADGPGLTLGCCGSGEEMPSRTRELLEAAVRSGNPQIVPRGAGPARGTSGAEQEGLGGRRGQLTRRWSTPHDPYWAPMAQVRPLSCFGSGRGDARAVPRELLEAASQDGAKVQSLPRAQRPARGPAGRGPGGAEEHLRGRLPGGWSTPHDPVLGADGPGLT